METQKKQPKSLTLSVQIFCILTFAVLLAVVADLTRKESLLFRGKTKAETSNAASNTEKEMDGFPLISLEELRALVENRARADSSQTVLLDAQTELFYADGHIPGAINLPSGNFDTLFPKLKEKLETASRIVVYCHDRSCVNSKFVANRLREKGIKNIVIYRGGIVEWEKKL